jgi:hypothetical protein
MPTNLPMIGIFWILKKSLIHFSKPLDCVQAVAGIKDTDFAHADQWAEVVKTHCGFSSKEYWEFPRGRIIYRVKTDNYSILASTSVVRDSLMIKRISRRFSLPVARVTVMSDRHYDPPGDDLFDD